jgi:tripartite-type tricarboxylate transporter receptor subunit TctC
VHSFKELLAYFASHPDGLEYVSSGTGTVGNAITEYIAAKEHKVNGVMIKIVTSTNLRKHLEDDTAEIRPMSAAEVTQFIHSEINKWTPVIRAASQSNSR